MGRTQHDAAMRLTQSHPAIRTASVITGLLLQLPRPVRTQVQQLVEQQLSLSLYAAPLVGEDRPDDPEQPRLRVLDDDDEPAVLGAGIGELRLHDGGDSGE